MNRKSFGRPTCTAAAKGDLNAVAQAVKDINDNYAPLKSRVKDTYAKLAPKAKAAARSSPHAFAEPRVAHALHESQYYLMPQQEELAQKVAQNPKDEAKKVQLKDVTDKIYDSLDDIRDALPGMAMSNPHESISISCPIQLHTTPKY